MASQYVADGLRRGERCLYAAGSQAMLDRFRASVEVLGVQTDVMIKRGALLLRTNAQAHLSGGGFDTERMLQMLNREVEASLVAGFSGFRTCGDMSWLLEHPDDWHHVTEYEALLNEFFRGVPACGMCQYDRRRLPLKLINRALTTHSTVFLDGSHQLNPLYAVKAGPRQKLRQQR